MLFQLCAGLVLVEQGELELLHFLKVVVEDELLGECRVEVVDGSFCPVILANRQGNRGQSQGLVPPFSAAGNHSTNLLNTNSEPATWPVTWKAAFLSSQRRALKHREVK